MSVFKTSKELNAIAMKQCEILEKENLFHGELLIVSGLMNVFYIGSVNAETDEYVKGSKSP